MTELVSRNAGLASPPAAAGRMSGLDYFLYSLTVFAWSTSWIALHLQLGKVSPEVSLVWRFALAAAAMFGWAVWSGARLAFPPRTHARFAMLGALLFSGNFVSFYYAGLTTPSGLLAVIFSCAALFNLGLGAVVFRRRVELPMAIGAALGFCGVLLMFSPRILGASFDHAALAGLGLCVLGTLLFCCGNMLSAVLQRAGIGVVSASAWGMAYGGLFLAIAAALRGDAFAIEPTLAYLGSLIWLSLVSSVMAFAAYLTLLGRIGATRAGYSTVIVPFFALLISTLAEGYVWTPIATAGLVLALAGNVLVLRSR